MRRGDRRAFSLIEVLVAVGILAVALMGLMATFATSGQLRATTKQNEYLQRQARGYLNRLQQFDQSAAARDFLANNPAWVALGPQTEGQTGQGVDQSVGVTVTAASARLMTEAEAAAVFVGRSFDLDRDGVRDSASSDTGAYEGVLPVVLTASWTDAQDPNLTRSTTLHTILYPRGSVVK